MNFMYASEAMFLIYHRQQYPMHNVLMQEWIRTETSLELFNQKSSKIISKFVLGKF